jgi:hypothetical protein
MLARINPNPTYSDVVPLDSTSGTCSNNSESSGSTPNINWLDVVVAILLALVVVMLGLAMWHWRGKIKASTKCFGALSRWFAKTSDKTSKQSTSPMKPSSSNPDHEESPVDRAPGDHAEPEPAHPTQSTAYYDQAGGQVDHPTQLAVNQGRVDERSDHPIGSVQPITEDAAQQRDQLPRARFSAFGTTPLGWSLYTTVAPTVDTEHELGNFSPRTPTQRLHHAAASTDASNASTYESGNEPFPSVRTGQ